MKYSDLSFVEVVFRLLPDGVPLHITDAHRSCDDITNFAGQIFINKRAEEILDIPGLKHGILIFR